MVINFSKLAKTKTANTPQKLSELFNQLDRKATHESLRPVQIEALAALDEQFAELDIVLKVSTGSGKTVVGLVYAELMRRKYPGEPVVYLCPTTQLVDQVIDSGNMIGVNVEKFTKDGPPHNALEGGSVLACTYDRLFNSKNTFSRNNIIPSAIILDDVHSGVDRVRSAYTAKVPDKAYDQIIQIFKPLCESTDPAIWRGIENNELNKRYEVPFWIWQPQSAAVAAILEKYKDDDELLFKWDNLSRYVEDARLCISGTYAELSLCVPPTEENKAYSGAKHRLFMSASIKDGSALIKDLNCSAAALERIIEPPSDRGAGERMILPIALIDPTLTKDDIAILCREFVVQANVVVLTSSSSQAAIWSLNDATSVLGNEVDSAVGLLRSTSKGNFVAFTQRFDGVDLPDDACRILVIDGIPTGERLCDQIDAERQKNSPGYNLRAINRFEQAIGRAVRSSADYAAVLLVGNDIAAFIGKRDVKELLENHTREQIDLGKDLADQIKGIAENSIDAIKTAITALLERDEAWKEAYRDRITTVTKDIRTGNGLTPNEESALAERTAWIYSKSRNHQGATSSLQQVIDHKDIHPIQRAELIFRMAAYMHHFEPGQAATLYRGAFQLNSILPRPAQMPDRKYLRVREQAVNLRSCLQEFTGFNAAISRLEEIRSKLAFSGDSELVEQGLYELGEILGATSSRPEKETGRGPDVLWLFDDITFVIEAKNEKHAPIYKSDAEQLLLSTQWCKDYCDSRPENIIPVFATNSLKADRPEDISFGPRFMTEQIVFEIVDQLRSLLNGLSYDGPLFNDAHQMNKKLLEVGLNGKTIVQKLK